MQAVKSKNTKPEKTGSGRFICDPRPCCAVDLEQLCPQYFDGDYPQWLQKQQEYWVPRDILERWGRKDTTMLNGEVWMLETQYEAVILMQLKNKGLEVVKRDDLFFY